MQSLGSLHSTSTMSSHFMTRTSNWSFGRKYRTTGFKCGLPSASSSRNGRWVLIPCWVRRLRSALCSMRMWIEPSQLDEASSKPLPHLASWMKITTRLSPWKTLIWIPLSTSVLSLALMDIWAGKLHRTWLALSSEGKRLTPCLKSCVKSVANQMTHWMIEAARSLEMMWYVAVSKSKMKRDSYLTE